MKYTQVSESALNTIQSMAVDREQEIIRLQNANANLLEFTKLAHRALEDCHRLLWSISGDDDTEREKLAELRSRVQDISVQALSYHYPDMSYKAIHAGKTL